MNLEIMEAYSRAHKEMMQGGACVPSCVAFTHKSDADSWLSGLRIKTSSFEVKLGATKLAQRWVEQVDRPELLPNGDKESALLFIKNHQKIWALTSGEGIERHMFAARKGKRKSCYVLDINPKIGCEPWTLSEPIT